MPTHETTQFRQMKVARHPLHAIVAILAGIAMTISTIAGAWAQAYPNKPIRMIVGFPPGGAVDIVARIVDRKVADDIGQQIVVDNRPGAGSAIATEMTAKAAPDGYTVFMTAASIAVNASLYKDLPYDPIKDFAAVILVASAPNVFLANPSLPAKSISQLIELARAKPGQLNFGSGGNGTMTHLSGELLKLMAHIDLTHVPYRGAPLALTDVIAGQVQLMVGALPGALAQIKAGRVVALAVTSAKRSSAAPTIPTVAESGLPGYEATNWYGVLAPAATSRSTVDKLNAEFQRALHDREVTDALTRQGADTLGGTPAEFEAYMKAETAKWAKVVREGKIRLK